MSGIVAGHRPDGLPRAPAVHRRTGARGLPWTCLRSIITLVKRDQAQFLREAVADAERRRVTLMLRAAIVEGDFADGKLPREWELMRDYRATRAVVRDALGELARQGVIDRQQGMGTRTATLPSVFSLREFHGVDGVPDQSTYPRVTDRSVIPTPPVVRSRIAHAGEQVLRVEYIAVAVEVPGAVSTNYFLLPECQSLADAEFGHNIYAFLANGGVTLSGSEFMIGAANADHYTAQRLAAAPGTPLLVLEQLMYGPDGRALCFSTVAQRGDRVRYSSRLGEGGPS